MNNLTEKVRFGLSACVHVAFAAFTAAMAHAVFALGEHYGQPLVYRLLVAGGCAAGIVGHGAAVTRPTTNASRTMHGFALGAWLVLSLFLASLYMFISSPQLAGVLPPEMVLIGAYTYSLAFGIGLLTSSIALVVPSVALKPITDAAHSTIGAVVTRYGESVVIMLAIAASSLHLFLFGQNVARLDLFSTITAMVIADLAFLVAEKRVLAEMRARRETGRYDAFDLVLWGAFGVAVLLYLVLVNIYAVRHSAGTLDMGDPMLRTVVDFYAASPTALLTALAILSIVSAFVDKSQGRPSTVEVVEGEARSIERPSALRQLADRIRSTRDGLAEVRAALTGDDERAAPREAVLTREVVLNGHSDDGAGAPRPKRRGR